MNTPTHLTLALATLGNKDHPKRNRWIFFGALLPDLAMFVLFFYELSIGTSQHVIWNDKYYSPLWQNTVDIFNSIPLFMVLLLIACHKRWIQVQFFVYAALLHIITDLFLHHDDAHRHWYPFSDWRFESPISYWDPNYYGDIWSIFECVLLVVTTYYACRIVLNRYAKMALVCVAGISVSLLSAMYLLQ